ncbi:ribosomal protein P1 beta [Ascoidea rubescens DSM 1968]|uniref:Ribosomal protein 60S n=1 Tax=Ascoidea rubescens DSM 1968 TaxID=1344418 RepID=A0A1D2VMG0_9ASCO|nr:ribosomal protein 60S [Ascoidea rubescens DSM 1968]ODV62792.1 ribosomal protein 60S [Ascoidea rubescens DSM 1968]
MSEAFVSYAALILADSKLDITSANLGSLIKAAGGSIDKVWTDVYAKALEGKDLTEVLYSLAASGPATGSGATTGGASTESGASEEKAAESESEEEEESDDDMGFGLFD